MNKLIFIIFISIGIDAFGQPTPTTANSPTDFIPPGYVLFSEIHGDLNKDNQADAVLIIKGTDRKNFVKHEYLGELDRNPRGMIIAFKNKDHYQLALDKRDCFSSENEDGGIYYAPELDISVERGILRVHYAHGRYGYWAYIFRYQNSDFELIGYDSSQNRGPVIERSISINLLTRKMQTQENINMDAEGGDEEFKEKWRKFPLPKPIRLRDIANFDGFDVLGTLGLRE